MSFQNALKEREKMVKNFDEGGLTGIQYLTNVDEIKNVLDSRLGDSKLQQETEKFWLKNLGHEPPELVHNNVILPKQVASSELEVLYGFALAVELGIDLTIPTFFEDFADTRNAAKMKKFWNIEYITSMTSERVRKVNLMGDQKIYAGLRLHEIIRQFIHGGTREELQEFYKDNNKGYENFVAEKQYRKFTGERVSTDKRPRLSDICVGKKSLVSEQPVLIVNYLKNQFEELSSIVKYKTKGKTKGHSFDISKNFNSGRAEDYYAAVFARFGLFNIYMDDLDEGSSGVELEKLAPIVSDAYEKVMKEFGLRPIIYRPGAWEKGFSYCIDTQKEDANQFVESFLGKYRKNLR